MERLERETHQISQKRRLTRLRRSRHALPVISIIGYTNTGKSTLLNTLTKSKVFTADMPFATLDPSSKRLRFPKDIEVIITDTVGFIRDLPTDLKASYMATLDELRDAHLLLEVIDLTDPHIDYRIQAVDRSLKAWNSRANPVSRCSTRRIDVPRPLRIPCLNVTGVLQSRRWTVQALSPSSSGCRPTSCANSRLLLFFIL